jgi:hypothetical protein
VVCNGLCVESDPFPREEAVRRQVVEVDFEGYFETDLVAAEEGAVEFEVEGLGEEEQVTSRQEQVIHG